MGLLKLFRQHRPLDIEQVSGFILMGGAAALYVRPNTSSLTWLSDLWGIAYLPVLFIALYLVCGFVLCLLTRSDWTIYALLTAPVILYGALLFSYYISNDQSIFTAGVFCAFWVFMQYAHSVAQEVRAWIKP